MNSLNCWSSASVLGAASMHSSELGVKPSLVGIGELETHFQNQGVDLVFILLPCYGIGPPLQTPVHVSLGSSRYGIAEHVETLGVPIIHCLLNSFFGLSTFCGEFGRAVSAEVDVPFFFSDNVWIFNDTGKRQIRAANEFFKLKTPYAVD